MRGGAGRGSSEVHQVSALPSCQATGAAAVSAWCLLWAWGPGPLVWGCHGPRPTPNYAQLGQVWLCRSHCARLSPLSTQAGPWVILRLLGAWNRVPLHPLEPGSARRGQPGVLRETGGPLGGVCTKGLPAWGHSACPRLLEPLPSGSYLQDGHRYHFWPPESLQLQERPLGGAPGWGPLGWGPLGWGGGSSSRDLPVHLLWSSPEPGRVGARARTGLA